MRKLLLVGLVGGAGCWTSSSKPASEPRPVEGDTSTGGATYGGRTSLLGTSHAGAGRGEPHGSSHSGGGAGTGTGAGRGGTGGTGGGGGASTGTIGTGKHGTIGHGTGSGYGVGAGGAAAPPRVSIGEPSGQSQALDPAIIRRSIRRNLSKIQYCYEKELLVTPGLEGRVDVRFSVGADGRVTQSTGSGMPPVDACVAGVIATIEFPRPTGGSVVIVSYPFIFQQPEPAPDPNATP
jgi:hypothetical protein